MSENNETENQGNNSNVPEEKSNFLGISDNIAGLLAYILGPITGLIWYFAEKNNKFVKFHAAQAIVLGALCVVLGWIFGIIYSNLYTGYIRDLVWNIWETRKLTVPFYISLFNWLQTIINIILGFASLFLMYKAYNKEEYKLPFLGKFVDKLANR